MPTTATATKLSKSAKSAAARKNGQHNGEPDPRRLKELLAQFLALRTYEARRKFLVPLSWPEQTELIKEKYKTLKTDRARDRYLNALTFEQLHSLMWGLTYDSHNRRRRRA